MPAPQNPTAKDAPPKAAHNLAGSKPAGNPAFRMMGLPNFKFKLPSRNWLIFWTVTGSFVSTLLYDRYHKKRAQQKWCTLVSPLADESLPTLTMPRRITIFLAAPPGDGLREAREHFHEYIKPILVAGAIDWEVIEGRREGEVRAGLAVKIRKLRKRRGESPPEDSDLAAPEDESKEQLLHELRQRTGIREWDGVQGDLILGRHTWKEYIRGLHEGWLGPLAEPKPLETMETPETLETAAPTDAAPIDENQEATSEPALQEESKNPDPPAPKPAKISPTPPYLVPTAYPTCALPQSLGSSLDPSLPLPLPHLLGFLNTPRRMYRFLTRRRLADSTGRSVAALVLAAQSRQFSQCADFASAVDPDDASPSTAGEAQVDSVALTRETWEQEAMLKEEEADWHKSAWKANDEGDEKERVWQEPMVVDSRIGQKMAMFELPAGADEKAIKLDEEKRLQAPSLVETFQEWTGWTAPKRHGSEMGLEGNEDE